MSLSAIRKAFPKRNSYITTFKRKLCGKKIGQGQYREVYECKIDPRYVVKIEENPEVFANIMEYMTYRQRPELHLYLAHPAFITDDGKILVQRRVKHKDIKYYPDRIPAVFCDLKITNCGWIGKRFVACDYGMTLSANYNKTRKARWWIEQDGN